MARDASAIARDEEGAAALEFALVGQILVLLLVAGIEFARIMLTGAVLEGAAANASRYGVTGGEISGAPPPTPAVRQQKILAIVAQDTAGLVDMSRLSVAVQAYPSFASVNDALPPLSPPPFDAGGPGDVVVYTLVYPQPLITGLLASVIGTGAITHVVRVVVQNEPY